MGFFRSLHLSVFEKKKILQREIAQFSLHFASPSKEPEDDTK